MFLLLQKINSSDSNLSTVIDKVINTVTLNHRRILSEARGGLIMLPAQIFGASEVSISFTLRLILSMLSA